MKYKKDIKKNIFRGYDIRGIFPTELDEDTAYTIGLGFGSYIKSLGKTTCIVGHDNRLSGMTLYEALMQGIMETGIDIIALCLCTTPMYYYACIKLKVFSGVMVTASHNPKDDNGFKFAFDESGNCKGQEIQDFLEYILKGEFSKGYGHVRQYDITDEYLELFRSNLNFGKRRVKCVIDPGNGTTAIIAKELFSMFPIDLIEINGESDGRFPNHHPDPCVEENLEQLKAKVLETGADVGLGFDGDGDRMGLVTATGKFIPTDKYMIIFIRDMFNKVANKKFLYDVKCSKCLKDAIEELGGEAVCYRTGNSYTKAAVRDMNLPFGGELSGHVYFRDRWLGFDSGLYAGLRMLELLSHTEKSVEDLLAGVNEYYSTPEIKVATPDDKKFAVVNGVLDYVKSMGYSYIDIDGARVEFDDGWALVRASNTGPNLTLRFEATSEERLKELQNEFTSVVNELSR